MATSALTQWGASNRAQQGSLEHLRIITICPECEVVPPNIREDFFSGDIICLSCGRILAERIIDIGTEWGPSIDNDSTDTDHSAGDYPATPASNYTASEYQASDYRGSEYSSSDYADSDYQGNNHPGSDYQGNDCQSSISYGSKTPNPDTPPTPAIIMQHVSDVSAAAPKVVLTIDVGKANFISQQVRNIHTRLWSLRYPARSFQHRIDHLRKRISESMNKWQKMTLEMNELDYWVFMDGPLHEEHETRMSKKTAIARTRALQQEEIRRLEFELESNKCMLDYKENSGKGSMTLLSIS